MKNWMVYNHAAIPTTSPDQMPDLRLIEDGSVWRISGEKVFLARWTTDFDCAEVTNWWYEIKDAPFDPAQIKAKHRYYINQGRKNFRIARIEPSAYAAELCDVTEKAYTAYPAKYRPKLDRDAFIAETKDWRERVYGAFDPETDRLCGYIRLEEQGRCLNFRVLRVMPEYEKKQINAALVCGMLEDCRELLENGGYINDGERSIVHETRFQDYLERYFGFRKAYCRLHIRYNPKIEAAVRLLYPMRGLLRRLDGIGVIHKINGVLKMEEIVREQAKNG